MTCYENFCANLALKAKAVRSAAQIKGYCEGTTRELAILSLSNASQGTYIIRVATGITRNLPDGFVHVLSLSVKHNSNDILHFPIYMRTEDDLDLYSLTGEPNQFEFPSVQDLLNFHKTHSIAGVVHHKPGHGELELRQVKDCKPISPLEHCECGMPKIYSRLPQGWTAHISREENSHGYLYFTNSEGQTSWELPEDVAELSRHSQYLWYGKLNKIRNIKNRHSEI